MKYASPVYIHSLPTNSDKGRWELKDANRQRICVMYDIDAINAQRIVDSINKVAAFKDMPPEIEQFLVAYYSALERLNKVTAAAFEVGEAVPISWPAWMGQHPRYGAQWCPTEEVQLKKEWRAGVPISRIASIHGRDAASIQCRLIRLFGDRYEEMHVVDRVGPELEQVLMVVKAMTATLEVMARGL